MIGRCRAALLVGVLGLVAGCSGDDGQPGGSEPDRASSMPVAASTTSPRAAGTTEPDDTDVATPAPAPAPTTVATSAAVDAVIDVDNQPGSDDYEGARDDVTDVTCTAYSGRWAAAGIVTNPTDTNVSYRIYVSYLDRAGETLGLIERDVDDVAPLEHSEWSTELESSAVDLSCVLRVERLAAG